MTQIPLVPLALALLLSGHGWRRKSLSPSGASTAFVVGFLMMAGGIRAFGVALIGFYLVGSRATKFGKQKKAKLEDGYHEAGYRTGWQVLSNSASALVAAFVWNAAFAPTSVHAVIARLVGLDVRGLLQLQDTAGYSQERCPIAAEVGDGWSRTLVLAGLGHFACCLGDTLASELGILSRSQPRLVTTFRKVPPGTNGGVSAWGTFVSVVGGAIVGFLVGLTLILENAKCFEGWSGVLLSCLGLGAFGGGFGSFIDSVLGATVQQTRYSKSKHVILQDESKSNGPVEVISGLNILTNNQVNLVSSVICAGVVGWLG